MPSANQWAARRFQRANLVGGAEMELGDFVGLIARQP